MISAQSNRLLIKDLYIVRRDALGKICWNLRKKTHSFTNFFGNTLYMFQEV